MKRESTEHIACRFFAAVILVAAAAPAKSETIKIVALGASNVTGVGVSSDQAWPAQLERMLRAKGYDVSVSVVAANGLSSAGILGSADAAATGARIVIFGNGGANDKKKGLSDSTAANTAQIRATIRAHGAVAIQIPPHVAARLVPQVIVQSANAKLGCCCLWPTASFRCAAEFGFS
jgi:acyl-CoA thioesterase-1